MRFDPDRVLADVRAGSPDALADRLARAGLDVTRAPDGLILARFPAGVAPPARVVVVTALDPANRTGPAFLAELARAWPRAQVEGVFAASPRLRAVERALPDGPGRTLGITIDAPGIGAIVLAGRGIGAELAAAAACDLWIPHRATRWRRVASLGPGGAEMGIGGVRDDRPIDRALLVATAQLVTEVALRWAKVKE